MVVASVDSFLPAATACRNLQPEATSVKAVRVLHSYCFSRGSTLHEPVNRLGNRMLGRTKQPAERRDPRGLSQL